MSTGGSRTQTTTTNNQPWAGAIPALNTALSGAQSAYAAGPPQRYQGSTVAGFNDQQMQGLNSTATQGQQALNMAMTGQNTLNHIMGSSAPRGATDTTGLTTPRATNTSGLANFTSGQPNPYLGDLYKQGARQIADDTNAQFSKAGRYGSGAHTNVLSRNMGDMWTNLASGAYENDRSRALTAANAMAGYSAGDQDRALTAANAAAGYSAGDQNRALTAYNSEAANRLSAANSLPGMYNLSQQGNRDILGVGDRLQQQQQNELNDRIMAWDYSQNANRANIEWLNAIASGQGQLGGTGSSTGANPNYRSAGDNLFGLGSSLGAAWLMSDRRLKADIEYAATDDAGNKWYTYRYVWDADGVQRVGVMADEAPAHAVAHDPGGFSMVNYGAL